MENWKTDMDRKMVQMLEDVEGLHRNMVACKQMLGSIERVYAELVSHITEISDEVLQQTFNALGNELAQRRAMTMNDKAYATRIEDIWRDGSMSARVHNFCKAFDIETLGDLCSLWKVDVLATRNTGKKALCEMEDMLEEHGLEFGDDTWVTRQGYRYELNRDWAYPVLKRKILTEEELTEKYMQKRWRR